MSDPYAAARERMVVEQLIPRGIRAPVLAAFREVPRERFVPEARRESAYEDRPLPLSAGQTISQPFMVARTSELVNIRPGARVLDVGTGSGYQAAILAAMGAKVISIERIASLAASASKVLRACGYEVHVVVGDGSRGWTDGAPYDGIVCAASAPAFPESWRRQLVIGGRAVLPIGTREVQYLTVVERVGEDEWRATRHQACVYVPLVGAEGWSGS